MLAPQFLSSMQKKKWLLFLLICVALLLITKALEDLVLEPWLKSKLDQYINSLHTIYHIDVRDANINLLTSTIQLYGVNVEADTGHLDFKNQTTLFSGSINTVSLSGVQFFKAWTLNKVEVNKIHFSELYLVKRQTARDTFPILEDRVFPLWPVNGTVNHVTFSDAKVLFEDLTDSRGFRSTEYTILSISMERWHMDKKDTMSTDVFKTIHYDIAGINSITKDSLYRLKIYKLAGDNDHMTVDSIVLHPQFSDYAFAYRNTMEQDRIHLKIEKLIMKDVDLDAFLDTRDIIADQVSIKKMDMDIFRDKRRPDNIMRKRMIAQLLRDYKSRVNVDSLKILGGRILYREHAEKAMQQGHISFKKVQGLLKHISNDSTQPPLQVEASAMFMGKSAFNVKMSFNIHDRNNSFTVSGKLNAMNLLNLNPILETNAYVKTSGKMKLLAFTFDADTYKSKGKLEMLYSDLELTAVSPKSDERKSLKELIIDLIAGEITHDANPKKGKPARIGTIDYERNPQKFFFNYSFKSILSGIKSVVLKKGEEEKSARNKKKPGRD
jgi:hypothetical protein